MDRPFVYEIRVEGYLSEQWSAWFDDLAIQHDPRGETKLTGLLSDQAALYGVLVKIHSLNLILVSVVRLPPDSPLPGRLLRDTDVANL
jgi:hypothetical protein